MFGKPSKLVSAFLEIPQLDGLPCLKAVTHSIYVFAFDRSCELRRYLLLSTFRRSSLKSTWSLQLIKWMSSECVWVCVNKCEYLYIQYETLAPPHGRSINQVYLCIWVCVCVCVKSRPSITIDLNLFKYTWFALPKKIFKLFSDIDIDTSKYQMHLRR